jgi:hypothetical protein
MSAVKVYAGWIKEGRDWENYTALYVGDTVLAKAVVDDMDEHGHWLSVRYGISPHEVKNISEILLTVLERLEGGERTPGGRIQIRYEHAYSDITGYLWTNEDLIVGGHDLLNELRSYKGKFAVIEITYHEEQVVASDDE